MTSPDYERSIQKEIAALKTEVAGGAKQIAKSLFSKRPIVPKKRAYVPFEPINLPDGREAIIIAFKTATENTDDSKVDTSPENNCVLNINTSPPDGNLSIPGLFKAVIAIHNGGLDHLALDTVTWERSDIGPHSTSYIAAGKENRVKDELEALRSCRDYLLDPLQHAMSISQDGGTTFVIQVKDPNTEVD